MKTRIGLEIELNSLDFEANQKLWTVDSEHCGYELKSNPVDSFSEFRRLMKSIRDMGKSSAGMFFNAGNHIHIDFLHQFKPNSSDLSRFSARKRKGKWLNPAGKNKRHFWVCADGKIWENPDDYLKQFTELSPSKIYSKPVPRVVSAVKRFLLIGKRFDLVLFGFQDISRVFNKYCNTLHFWDEDELMSMETIKDICENPALGNDKRRRMFNPLAFSKFGTIEVRMMKGSLGVDDVWAQIFLFSRLSHLAKSNARIPRASGHIREDAKNLLDAAKIRGKIRRHLLSRLDFNLSEYPSAQAICYSCEEIIYAKDAIDVGLSRAACAHCANSNVCDDCGIMSNSSAYQIEATEYKSNACYSCREIDMGDLANDFSKGLIYVRGESVHKSELDENYKPRTLRRILNEFN